MGLIDGCAIPDSCLKSAIATGDCVYTVRLMSYLGNAEPRQEEQSEHQWQLDSCSNDDKEGSPSKIMIMSCHINTNINERFAFIQTKYNQYDPDKKTGKGPTNTKKIANERWKINK